MFVIVEPFHLIHKTELTTQENDMMEKDTLYSHQEQAMMSTAKKDVLATYKEWSLFTSLHNKERCMSKKNTSMTVCNMF